MTIVWARLHCEPLTNLVHNAPPTIAQIEEEEEVECIRRNAALYRKAVDVWNEHPERTQPIVVFDNGTGEWVKVGPNKTYEPKPKPELSVMKDTVE